MENKQDFSKQIEACRPEDFDGHTDYNLLSPEQKLDWLSEQAKFLWEMAQENPQIMKRFFPEAEEKNL